MPQPFAPPVELVPTIKLFYSPSKPRHNDASVPHCAALTTADLEALCAEDVPWTFRDEPHVYRAVALDRVLSHCGFDEGPGGRSIPPTERRPAWRQIVIARASDVVVAVFTCAEFMPQMGRTRTFVAWAVDGRALPTDEGPVRIVVASDLKGSRSLRQVVEVRVVDVREVEAR